MELAIDRREADSLTVVEVSGELDVYTAPRLGAALADSVAKGHKDLVVDLTKVTFMDSTALGVLVSSRQMVVEGDGRLRLVLSNPHVGKIMRITGFQDVFEIYSTLGDAVSPSDPAA
ncbi:MAG: STAS domain-containing protein [Gaiellales bacterium]|nr:STAS domain-containing protein [Gaiellales bacterium]